MISINILLKSWDKFFFEEQSTRGLAIFRILWTSMLLLTLVMDWENGADFYGPHALLSLDTVQAQFPRFHLNFFRHFGQGLSTVVFFQIVFLISLLTSLLGLYTRQSLVIVLIMLVSFHQRNIWLLSSSEVLMRTMTLLLIFTPCGNTLSVDAVLGRFIPSFARPVYASVWALRLIQIQISVVYLWTVWHKLKGETWIDGTALYYASRLENMTNFSLPYLMDSMWFMKLSTWGTLVLEFALGALIWVKEFRRPLIITGLMFHLGIEYLMSIPFFEINLMVLLINFYTPEEFHSLIDRVKIFCSRFFRESAWAVVVKDRIEASLRSLS